MVVAPPRNMRLVHESEISDIKKSFDSFKKGEIAFKTADVLLTKLSKSLKSYLVALSLNPENNPKGLKDAEAALVKVVSLIDADSSDVEELSQDLVLLEKVERIAVEAFVRKKDILNRLVKLITTVRPLLGSRLAKLKSY